MVDGGGAGVRRENNSNKKKTDRLTPCRERERERERESGERIDRQFISDFSSERRRAGRNGRAGGAANPRIDTRYAVNGVPPMVRRQWCAVNGAPSMVRRQWCAANGVP
jgi:hypothetical protein